MPESVETLQEQLKTKDKKLKNQAVELDHLTNVVVPDLKKENKKLRKVKRELTEALETSTKKYFDQLEINADLSESVTKKGAGLQLAKVRLEEIEKLVLKLEEEKELEKAQAAPIDEEDLQVEGSSEEDTEKIRKLANKVKSLEKELSETESQLNNAKKDLKNKTSDLKQKSSLLKEKEEEIEDLNDNVIPSLKLDNTDLRVKLKNATEKIENSENGVRGEVVKLEAKVKDLESKLDSKIRDYDKLNTNLNNKDKKIKSLKNKNKELSDKLNEKSSSKGFFSKLTGR